MTHLMHTYARLPVAFTHGEGAWQFDAHGRRYLDDLAGIAVSTLGHGHPRLTQAIAQQAQRLLHTSNLYQVHQQEELADRLAQLADMDEVFFCNSGCEANEPAIKLARYFGHGRGIELPNIVVMEKAFETFMRQTLISDFDYHGNAKARAEADRDGLVSVGDVGYLDSDGYLFLCDRKRDMVISGGVNIYPAEIENALIGMAGVRHCAVFGVPHDEYGERLFACVEPEADSTLSVAAIQEFLRGKLANFKVPRDIRFMDALPREATGKIFKRKLRDLYREGQLR